MQLPLGRLFVVWGYDFNPPFERFGYFMEATMTNKWSKISAKLPKKVSM